MCKCAMCRYNRYIKKKRLDPNRQERRAEINAKEQLQEIGKSRKIETQ